MQLCTSDELHANCIFALQSKEIVDRGLKVLTQLKQEADAGVSPRDRQIIFLDNGEVKWQAWDAAQKKYLDLKSADPAARTQARVKVRACELQLP